ncbi:hypothetical protein GUJ93_ZPchr0008g12971 [Zizania palustris]|uniref:Uncharacterized protein n=1 Tax=Zizania palustris TaxID=103762 RepID=A0A8J5RD17_ZIZPA|nr:hypothetical protein GUJ93_ZPchr0008g12971 [Zizania palustris]
MVNIATLCMALRQAQPVALFILVVCGATPHCVIHKATFHPDASPRCVAPAACIASLMGPCRATPLSRAMLVAGSCHATLFVGLRQGTPLIDLRQIHLKPV